MTDNEYSRHDWFALQRYRAITRPGSYDLYCVGYGGTNRPILRNHPPTSASPLFERVSSALSSYEVRYPINIVYPYFDSEAGETIITFDDLLHSLKRATSFAHYRFTIREGTEAERAEMVARHVAASTEPSPAERTTVDIKRVWENRNGIYTVLQSDFYEYVESIHRFAGGEIKLHLGLLAHPDSRFTALLLDHEPNIAQNAFRYVYNPGIIGNLVEILTHENPETARLALHHLRETTGGFFAATELGAPAPLDSIENREALQEEWRQWWLANKEGFVPDWTGQKHKWIDIDGNEVPAESWPKPREPEPVFPEPFKTDGLWGYRTADGTVVVQPMYEEARPFTPTLATVKRPDRGYGVIDRSGNFVLPTDYDEVQIVEHRGCIDVRTGSRSGRFSLSGEPLIPIEFNHISMPQGDLAAVRKDGLWGVWRHGEGYVAEPQYSSLNLINNELAIYRPARSPEARGQVPKAGLLDATNNEPITEAIYGNIDIRIGDGLIGFFVQEGDLVRRGFMDEKGRVVIDPKFTATRPVLEPPFNDGTAIVGMGQPDSIRYGLINTEGNFVVEPRFVRLSRFKKGLAAAYIQDGDVTRCGYIDPSGDWAIEPEYVHCHDFQNGIARVTVDDPMTFHKKQRKIEQPFASTGLFGISVLICVVGGAYVYRKLRRSAQLDTD